MRQSGLDKDSESFDVSKVLKKLPRMICEQLLGVRITGTRQGGISVRMKLR